ncbi:MAG: LamG domain-containing protein, partial [Candidatus Omnitrophica bacterium]|nr:LamG domain-containing protein [Candidatus Omnitrophota bacterium]
MTKSLTVPGGTEIASSDTGLVGLWHMNEGTGTSVADSAGTNTGTWAGTGTHWETTNPKLGAGAGKFNGSNDYVGVPDSDAWNFTASDGTIDFWFKVNSMPSIAGGLINQVNNDNHWTIYYYSDGKIGVGTSGVNEITSASGVISTGVWYHVAVVKSGSTTTIYVAGNQVASATTAVWTSSPNPLRIGGHSHWNVDYNHTGLIDEVAIYNRALTGEEIKDHYLRGVADLRTYARSGSTSAINSEVIPASGTDVDTTQADFDAGVKTNCSATVSGTLRAGDGEISSSESGLVSLWHMNNDWLDSKGSYNGTATGATFETTDPKLGSASGKFDGVDDYVSINPDILSNAGAATIEAWIKLNSYASTSQSPILVDRTTTQFDFQFVMYPDDNNPHKLLFSVYNTAGAEAAATSSTDIPLATWTYVVAVYNGTNVMVYINGAQNGSIGSLSGNIQAISNDCRIGGDVFGSPEFNGTIDEVAIYNRALTAEEIQQHYEAGSVAAASVFVSKAVDLGSGGAVKAETVKLTADIPTGATLKIYAGSCATEGGTYSWDTGSELFSTVGNNQTLTHTAAAAANRWWKYKIEGTTNGVTSWVVYDATLSSKAGYRDSSQAEFEAGTKTSVMATVSNSLRPSADNGQISSSESSLVGLWHMNESSWNGTANEVVDSKGTNHGVRVGNANTTSSAKLGPYAGTFDGTGDYVDVANSSDFIFGTGAFTIEGWIKTPKAIGSEDFRNLVGHGALAAANGAWNFGYGSIATFGIGNRFVLEYQTGGGGGEFLQSGQLTINTDTWYHMVFSYNGTTAYIFQNGVKVGEHNVSLNLDLADRLIIGAREFDAGGTMGGYHTGLIDEVAIYKGRALTQSEIQQHYEAGSPAATSTFESSVLDLGAAYQGDLLAVQADVPNTTTLSCRVRVGTSSTPDAASWDVSGTNWTKGTTATAATVGISPQIFLVDVGTLV